MSDNELNRVRDAAGELQRRREAAEEALRDLHAAIAGAAKAGAKQRDIVEITGLSRERVRQISREAGVGPS